MKKIILALCMLLALPLMAQSQYVTTSVSGTSITFKNVSSKTISEMGGDLLNNNEVVGVYTHTFATGFLAGTVETMDVPELAAPSVTLKYITFKDGTGWKAPIVPSTTTDTLSGQTLYLDLSNSYCKANTFTPGYTLHGTWRNSVTGCSAYGSRGASSPYACAQDPNYGYPDLAYKTCKVGLCCTIHYIALRPTVAADNDCLSTGNGFYTGIQGEQQ